MVSFSNDTGLSSVLLLPSKFFMSVLFCSDDLMMM
jgi:hypothetical protein